MKIINIDINDEIIFNNVEDFDTGSKVGISSIVKIPTGNYNNILLNFSFANPKLCEELFMIASFKIEENQSIDVEIKEVKIGDKTYNHACYIPSELLEKPCEFTLGVYGFKLNEDKSLKQRISLVPVKNIVVKGSYDPNSKESITPTPTLFEVYLDKIKNATSEIEILKEDTEKQVKELQTKLENDIGENIERHRNSYQEYKNTYIITKENTTIIPIGVSFFDEDCILQIYVNGIRLIEGTDYTIDVTNKNIILSKALNKIGTEVHKIVLKTIAQAEIENIIPKANAKGNDITITNSANYRFKDVQILGDLQQNQFSGKNKLDTSIIETQLVSGVQITRYDDGSINLNGTSTSGITLSKELKVPINLIANQNYILSTKNKLSSNIEAFYLRDENDSAIFTVPSTANSVSLTPTENKTIKYIRIYIQNGQKINLTLYPQLEANTVETDYEPYVGGMPSPNNQYPQPIDVVTGNNKIVISNKNILSNYTVINNKNTYMDILKAKGFLQPNKTYTLSFDSKEAGNQYYLNEFLFKTSPRIVTQLGRNEISATTKDVINTSDLGTYDNNGYILLKNARAEVNSISIINPMLELGTKATSYVQHEGVVLPLNLGNIELCKIGDYQDSIYKENGKWYKESKIGSYNFSGNERMYDIQVQNELNVFTFHHFLTEKIYINNAQVIGACNRFRGTAWDNRFNENDMYLLDTNNNICRFITNSFKSNAELLQYLKENETILKYIKAEPTKEEITDVTLINQLNAIKNACSYVDETNIFSIDNAIDPIFDVTYFEDLKQTKTDLLKIVNPVGTILIRTSNINPSTDLGFGTWSLKSNEAGLYYFERTE